MEHHKYVYNVYIHIYNIQAYNDISWHEACCNTHFHEVSWSLTPLQFVAESCWLDVTSDWMYLDMLQCIHVLQHVPAWISPCTSWGAWLVPDPVVHWLDWGIWILLRKVWLGLHEGCHHVWNSGRLWRWISYLPGQGLWPRGEEIQVECWTCKRTSGNDGHYRYVLSRWCCAQRVACSLHVLCMFFARSFSLHVLCMFFACSLRVSSVVWSYCHCPFGISSQSPALLELQHRF